MHTANIHRYMHILAVQLCSLAGREVRKVKKAIQALRLHEHTRAYGWMVGRLRLRRGFTITTSSVL